MKNIDCTKTCRAGQTAVSHLVYANLTKIAGVSGWTETGKYVGTGYTCGTIVTRIISTKISH